MKNLYRNLHYDDCKSVPGFEHLQDIPVVSKKKSRNFSHKVCISYKPLDSDSDEEYRSTEFVKKWRTEAELRYEGDSYHGRSPRGNGSSFSKPLKAPSHYGRDWTNEDTLTDPRIARRFCTRGSTGYFYEPYEAIGRFSDWPRQKHRKFYNIPVEDQRFHRRHSPRNWNALREPSSHDESSFFAEERDLQKVMRVNIFLPKSPLVNPNQNWTKPVIRSKKDEIKPCVDPPCLVQSDQLMPDTKPAPIFCEDIKERDELYSAPRFEKDKRSSFSQQIKIKEMRAVTTQGKDTRIVKEDSPLSGRSSMIANRPFRQKRNQRRITGKGSKSISKQRFLANKSNSTMRRADIRVNLTLKSLFHPKLGRKVNSSHPDYMMLIKRRRKTTPHVGMHMKSCAIWPKGSFGGWDFTGNKAKLNQDNLDELEEPTKRVPEEVPRAMFVEDAPSIVNQSALQYLQNAWSWNVGYTLPKCLKSINSQDALKEKMFQLKYILQFWKIGPRTKMEIGWIKRALLSFSEQELNRAISNRADWKGLTEFLNTTISFCKGQGKGEMHTKHELWMEHDMPQIARNLAKNAKMATKFLALSEEVSYDTAPNEVKLILLNALNFEVRHKGSWWEKGQHLAYVCFQWPEGENLGVYHVIFDIESRVVSKKWQHHFRKEKDIDDSYRGWLIYCSEKYTQERFILESASKEIPRLRFEVAQVVQRSSLKEVCSYVLEFWQPDMGLLVFRVLQRKEQ